MFELELIFALSSSTVSEKELSSGEFFFRSHPLATGKMEEIYGSDSECFIKRGIALGGKQVKHGDVAIELQVLPRIPVTVILWKADDEFPARVQMLFDPTIDTHMQLDAIWSLGFLVEQAMSI